MFSSTFSTGSFGSTFNFHSDFQQRQVKTAPPRWGFLEGATIDDIFRSLETNGSPTDPTRVRAAISMGVRYEDLRRV